MLRRLQVFISSTSDLSQQREAVEEALSELEIDGSRFESWPSSPRDPVAECLRRIEEADAVVLLLGSRYGSIDVATNTSVTHLEYRHARSKQIPVFPFLFEVSNAEQRQNDFIEEVRKECFHCSEVQSSGELKRRVRQSFIEEFVACFRETYRPPDILCSREAQAGALASEAEDLLEGDAEQVYASLSELYSQRQFEAIDRLSARCLDLFPNAPHLLNVVYMAVVNLAMDRLPHTSRLVVEAIEFWRGYLADGAFDKGSLLYNIGNALGALGHHREAIHHYRQSIELNAGWARAWKNLGNEYVELGETTQALECFRAALDLDPVLAEALQSIGATALVEADDPEKCLSILSPIDIDALKPTRASGVHGWRALAHLRLGSYKRAAEEIELAIRADANAVWAWRSGVTIYHLLRHDDRSQLVCAIDFFGRYLVRFPFDSRVWAEVGLCKWLLWRCDDRADLVDEARESLERAVQLGFDEDPLVFDRLGHLLERSGDLIGAERLHRRAIEGGSEIPISCLGINLMMQDRTDEAIEVFEGAVLQYPDDGCGWMNLGTCLAKVGRTADALAAAKKATEVEPGNASAWFKLGGIHFIVGNLVAAERIWKNTLARFPDHEEAERARIALQIVRDKVR